MTTLLQKLRRSEYIHYSYTYLAMFVLSLSYVMVVYINSTFLSRFADPSVVSILYAIGAAVTITMLLSASHFLEEYGNRHTMLFLLVLEGLALLVLGTATSFATAAFAFIIHDAVAPLLLFNLDVFLESGMVRETHTGTTRGMFLTMSNLAYVIGPAIVGAILIHNQYAKVYIVAAAILVPLFIFIKYRFRSFADPKYPHLDARKSVKEFFAHSALANIFWLEFALQCFYAMMTIAVPIYLHNVIGFSWPTIGGMLSIVLLPFIMLQIPGGFLADKDGEEQFMKYGLVVMALSVFAAALLHSHVAAYWTAVLFMSRVGAAIVEVMIESFFFRHVKGKDARFISVFRMATPVAYIAAPLALGIILPLAGYGTVFAILGIFLLLNIARTRAI